MPTLEDLMREYKENDELRKIELKRARKLCYRKSRQNRRKLY